MDWSWIKAKIEGVCGFWFMELASISPTKNDILSTGPAPPPALPGQIPARRMWPFGFRSIIPRGVECVTVSPMASQQRVIVGAESNSFGPTDLKEGEVAIYCKIKGVLLKFDVKGKITLDAAKGQDVQINGGKKMCARDGEDVQRNAQFAAWCARVQAGIVAGGGADPGLAPTIIANVKGGAKNVKV